MPSVERRVDPSLFHDVLVSSAHQSLPAPQAAHGFLDLSGDCGEQFSQQRQITTIVLPHRGVGIQ